MDKTRYFCDNVTCRVIWQKVQLNVNIQLKRYRYFCDKHNEYIIFQLLAKLARHKSWDEDCYKLFIFSLCREQVN